MYQPEYNSERTSAGNRAEVLARTVTEMHRVPDVTDGALSAAYRSEAVRRDQVALAAVRAELALLTPVRPSENGKSNGHNGHNGHATEAVKDMKVVAPRSSEGQDVYATLTQVDIHASDSALLADMQSVFDNPNVASVRMEQAKADFQNSVGVEAAFDNPQIRRASALWDRS